MNIIIIMIIIMILTSILILVHQCTYYDMLYVQ